jgi:uncharacterized protein (UPF0333 family)
MKKHNRNVLLIVLALVIILGVVVFVYKSIWKEPQELLSEDYIRSKAQVYCANKGEEDSNVNICGNYVAVVKSPLGAGITYYRTDGASFSCPVVGPDSMTPECKNIYEGILAKTFKCVNVC